MRAPSAPSPPPIRLHPEAAAVEVQALYRGVVISSRYLGADDADPFLIGSAKGVDAPAAAHLLSGAAHPLVSMDERGFAVELTDQMVGTVIFEDRAAMLHDLVRAHGPSFVPPPTARLQISCGEVAFLVSTTAPPTALPRPAAARLKDHWPALVTAAGVLLVMSLLAFLPPDRQVLVGDTMDLRREWLKSTIIPKVPPPGPSAPAGDAGGGIAGGGDRSPRPAARPSARRVAARPRGTAPADDGRTGILGVLLASEGKSWNHLFSNDPTFAPGAFANLISGDPSDMGPGLGGGPVGTGFGPPGALAGSGPLAGIGQCDAVCQAGRDGRARRAARLADRGQPRGPNVIPSIADVRGSLDKDIVRRVIRRHLNEVKFCYEQQLVRRPELAGRLTVQFTIAPTGAVMTSAVQTSTLANLAVESCVVQAVRRWEFPRPDGGGLVIVSYPFVLVPAGSS